MPSPNTPQQSIIGIALHYITCKQNDSAVVLRFLLVCVGANFFEGRATKLNR